MIAIDPQASLKFFQNVASHTDRDVQQRLDRFQGSLQTWLHSALNWPPDDWEADLRLFVSHSRYDGWEISPHSLAQIRELLEARAKRTGPFSAARAARGDDLEKPTIQLAAVMAPGQDNDATLDLTSKDESEGTARKGALEEAVDLEVAGRGPDVSEDFRAKVQGILDILDPVAAEVWKTEGGIIQSRNARGWLLDYYSKRIDGRPAIIVDQTYTAGDTALAILEEAYTSRANPIRSEMLRRWILEDGAAVRFREIQTQAYREAAAEAAMLAELYYGAISSLTPTGDLIVTLDDIDRNGLSLSQALIFLPAMATFGGKVKGIVLKIAGGKLFKVPTELLEKLGKLPRKALNELAAKVRKAKTREEALGVIKKGTSTKLPAKARPSATKSPTRPAPKKLKPPGNWFKEYEDMSDAARAYQTQITGRTYEVYRVENVKFDGYKDGVLIECKGRRYRNFVDKESDFKYWFSKLDELLDQARRQVGAAKGIPVEWVVAEHEFRDALIKLFRAHGLNIRVRWVPAR